MIKKDKKVFVLSLVVSSFALMATLKAQNYSYESYPQSNYHRASSSEQNDLVGVRPLSAKKSVNLFDVSSVYNKDVSVSYTNDDYPMNEVSTKRKVMRVAAIPNYFQDGANNEEWTVRIGDEAMAPMGFAQPGSSSVASSKAVVGQQNSLLADEMFVEQNATTSEASRAFSANNGLEYQELQALSKKIQKEQVSPWAKAEIKRKNYQSRNYGSYQNNNAYNVASQNNVVVAPNAVRVESSSVSPLVVERTSNPWSSNSVSNFSANEFNIMRPTKSPEYYNNAQNAYYQVSQQAQSPVSAQQLQQQQQAFLSEQTRYSNQSYGNATVTANMPVITPPAVEVYGNEVSVSPYKVNANYSVTNSGQSVYGQSQSYAQQNQQQRPLLVPIQDDSSAIQSSQSLAQVEPVSVGSVQSMSNSIPVAPLAEQISRGDDSNISLTELKVNFKPMKSDMSVQTVRWLKEFSKKAATDYDNVVEIRISPNLPVTQNERVLMIKGVLNSNGVYDQQIKVIPDRRSADSIIVKVLENNENQSDLSLVDYNDIDGSYYYYY